MQTRGIVIAVEEYAQISVKILDIPILRPADFLLLQSLQEAFAFRIVLGIARPAHARNYAVLEQRVDVGCRRILNSAIGMVD